MNLIIDGTTEDGTFQGGANRPPFIVFDIDSQLVMGGYFLTYQAAEHWKELLESMMHLASHRPATAGDACTVLEQWADNDKNAAAVGEALAELLQLKKWGECYPTMRGQANERGLARKVLALFTDAVFAELLATYTPKP